MRFRPVIRPLLFLGPVLAGALATQGAGAAETGRARGANTADFTFACPNSRACRPQAGPGPADRQVDPFAGSLGRPCAYRRRETPSGPRKVRVCY